MEYKKDLGEKASDFEKEFDISNRAFFMTFDKGLPVGGATVTAKTSNVNMLEGRDDLSILWDIRVRNEYRGRGIGFLICLVKGKRFQTNEN